MHMKSITSVAMAVVCAVALPGCSDTKEQPTELRSGVIVLNVLSKAQYDDCHIKGSEHVALDELESFAQNIAKDADIIVYCSNYQCSASEFACEKLLKLGFTHVHAYEGGMAEWLSIGLPCEGPCQAEYLKKKNVKSEDEPAQVPVIEAHELAKKLHING